MNICENRFFVKRKLLFKKIYFFINDFIGMFFKNEIFNIYIVLW